MMNKLVILLLSACCLLMTACDKENDETAQGFRIMNADVDLAAGGGTVEVALQATGELTAVSGADWCRVIEVTNEKITLLARANYEYTSRATQVTVSDGNSEQRGIDWVEVPAASKEDGFLLVLKENKTGNPRACQLLVSTNEGRKFLYYVYQYEATDLLGVWGNSRIYVKWDTKNIENAYPLSATEISKNVDGEGYTIKMSLANTPAAQYLKDPAKATISLQATYENGSFVVPIGAAQKDFTVVEEVADEVAEGASDGTSGGVSDGTSDDGAGVVLQTLYGFSVAASSNIYSKGNFGFAPVLYQDGSVGVSFQDVTGAPESGCYLAIALFDGQQFLTGTLKDCILFPDIALFR